MLVDLRPRGGLVVVVGAGAEGLRRVRQLLREDCRILVVSDGARPEVEAYARRGRLELRRARLRGASFLSRLRPYIVMAATDDPELNGAVAARARAMGCLAYAADDPAGSDFGHPATVRVRGVVQVAFSTGGLSPGMAAALAARAGPALSRAVTAADARMVRLHGRARAAARRAIPTQAGRRGYLRAVARDARVKRLIKDGRQAAAWRRAEAMLEGRG